jgi:hypothetical protein
MLPLPPAAAAHGLRILSETCAAARAHKLSCAKLWERCEGLLRNLPPTSQEIQTRLHELLEEMNLFMKKIVKPGNNLIPSSNPTREDNQIMISWFERVLDDLTPDLSSFQSFTEKINQLKCNLLGPPPIENLSHSQAERLADCENIRCDLESFSQEISSFRRDQRSDGARVLQLQTRCSLLLFLFRSTNDQISQLQKQVGGVVNLSNSPLEAPNNNETREIRTQLTQISHTIEDLRMTSKEMVPQQERLINELNDSLLETICESQLNLATFSDECSKLRESAERFRSADHKLDVILDLITKESLRKDDE